MISRAPGLKLVVETLITSLRPIGNIVLICCAFFIVFGILGVQVSILHFPFSTVFKLWTPFFGGLCLNLNIFLFVCLF